MGVLESTHVGLGRSRWVGAPAGNTFLFPSVVMHIEEWSLRGLHRDKIKIRPIRRYLCSRSKLLAIQIDIGLHRGL